MEVKIDREIRTYAGSMFFGLSMRQSVFALLAIVVAVGLYFPLRPYQLCGLPPGMVREQAVLDLRAVPGRAMTDNGDNDIVNEAFNQKTAKHPSFAAGQVTGQNDMGKLIYQQIPGTAAVPGIFILPFPLSFSPVRKGAINIDR